MGTYLRVGWVLIIFLEKNETKGSKFILLQPDKTKSESGTRTKH